MIRFLVVFLVAGFPTLASAFVPTQTCTDSGAFKCADGETPKQVRWKERCVSFYAHEAGTTHLSGDQGISADTEAAILSSFGAWTDVSCSDLTFTYGGITNEERAEYVSARGTSGNANIVVWRDEEWPYASKTAFAITSVTFNPESGLIVDADIELNGEHHVFTAGDRNVQIDLQNTLTHEVGHFLGLDHAPDQATTMFLSAGVGEVQKRTLEADDIAGVCAIYPVVDANRVCASPAPFVRPEGSAEDDGCCATVPRRGETPLGAILAGLLALLVRRKFFS